MQRSRLIEQPTEIINFCLLKGLRGHYTEVVLQNAYPTLFFMKKPAKILLVISLVYAAYIFLYISKFDFNLSALIEFSRDNITLLGTPLPSNLVIMNHDGYDGQLYYLTATDPWRQDITISVNWYQRILYPLLAHLLVFGKSHLLPLSLVLLNFVSIILGTRILLKILEEHNVNLNLAYVYAFNVGFVMSMTRDLPEPLVMLFILLSVFYLRKNYFLASGFCCLLAVLAKDYALLYVIPLLLFLLFHRRWREFSYHLLLLIPYALWLAYLTRSMNETPLAMSFGNASLPFLGIMHYFNWIKLPGNIHDIYTYFSPMPVLAFTLIQCTFLLKPGIRKLNLYQFIGLAQVLFILSLNAHSYSSLLDAVGRYAIILILFSILYAAEKQKSYDRICAILLIIMSVGFAILKLFSKTDYFIS